jgi:hypothetical protein
MHLSHLPQLSHLRPERPYNEAMSTGASHQLQPLVDDLQRIFGTRLKAVVKYGWRPHDRIPSLALVDSLTPDDLTACATRAPSWHRHGCATPLMLTPHEFARSLDAFPIEYDEILATSEVVTGKHPFDGLSIAADDLRRACEVQVKSHLLHPREDYLEGGARPSHTAALVRESAPAFIALLRRLARLDHVAVESNAELVSYVSRRVQLDARVVSDLLALTEPHTMSTVDAGRIFPAYLSAIERLAEFVDSWRS